MYVPKTNMKQISTELQDIPSLIKVYIHFNNQNALYYKFIGMYTLVITIINTITNNIWKVEKNYNKLIQYTI